MRRTTILPASAMTSRVPALAVEPASWMQIPGTATQVTATMAGTIYVLSDQPAGSDKYIWEYANGAWTNLPGLASQVVASDGELLAINSSGGIYAYDGSNWSAIAGGASSIAEDPDGSIYVVSNSGTGPDRAIWRYYAGAWTQVPGSGIAVVGTNDTSAHTVAGGTLAPNGIYVVNSAGAIYYLNSDGTYVLLSGTATGLAPTGFGGLFALASPHDPDGNTIYYYDFANQDWTTYPGLALSIADSSLANTFYAVSPSGAIYTTSANVTGTPTVNGVRVDTDPFSNADAQHATEVEPSAYAVGTTIVSAFQAGRFTTGGASALDVATSFDGGHTWTAQSLPGVTKAENPDNAFNTASDPVVAYDAKRANWLVIGLAVVVTGDVGPAFSVSSSHDGTSWNAPTYGPPVSGPDKPWIACDNTSSSPYYGNCYTSWEDGFGDGYMYVSTSIDGGATWGAPYQVVSQDFCSGVAPVVRANGTVVVPVLDETTGDIEAFSSTDGGSTWGNFVTIGSSSTDYENQTVRSFDAPSVAMDASGTIYATWQYSDTSDQVLFAKSVDGVQWSAPSTIPTTPGDAGTYRMVPALGSDPAASGHLGLTFYAYDPRVCCHIAALFTASNDGGATWSTPAQLAGPIDANAISKASSFAYAGPSSMLGDYIATVSSGGAFVSIFSSANPMANATFDQAIYASVTSFAAADSRARIAAGTPSAMPRARSTRNRRILPPD